MDVKVTGPMLDAAARMADDVSTGISTEVGVLKGVIETVGASSLRGAAGTQFTTTSAELDVDVHKLTGALGGMAEAVRASRSAFTQADEDSASAVNRAAAGGAYSYTPGEISGALG
jgi:WXG100 family type VII secretion target